MNYTLQPKTQQFLEQTQKMLIGGEWCEGKETFKTLNPANGEVLVDIPLASKSDVDDAVIAARKVFHEVWANFPPAQRSALLWKLSDLMERDKQILVELETLDNGKPLGKAEYDVTGAINHLRYYAGWATKIEGSTIPVNFPNTFAYSKREPLGVVGLIVPWNFPLMIAMWKLAPALACGNTVLLKPAEQTPLTALYLGKLIQEADFPAGVVNILTGPGSPTGEAITMHTDIDKVSFTGSTAVGRKIMEAAAKSNLKKVSLELGGKSPNVVFADADMENVMAGVHWSSFYNTGQECTLGSRLYVQQPIYEQVVENLSKSAEQLSIGAGLSNPDLGPMISEAQMNRVMEYMRLGKEEGAELITGGKRCEGDLANGYFLSPTIFTHQNNNLRIVKEEIFGPVVAVSSFKSIEDVIEKANDTEYGLAAAVWTKDIQKAFKYVNAVQAGTVWVNGYDYFDAAVPFGGYKASGMGKEMGKSAIELYTQEKSVWIGGLG